METEDENESKTIPKQNRKTSQKTLQKLEAKIKQPKAKTNQKYL